MSCLPTRIKFLTIINTFLQKLGQGMIQHSVWCKLQTRCSPGTAQMNMPSTNSFVVCQPLQPHHPQECSVFVARDMATYPPIAQTNHFVSQPLKTQNHVQFLTEQAHAATPPVSETRPISVVSQNVGGHTLEKIALTLDKHFNPIPQTIHTPVNVAR